MTDETLKEKCLRLRSASDYKLESNSFILCMLDGRSFSHKIKNKFEKPFDMKFVAAMNETMQYLCENVQGCRVGYCQSDEITLVISDIPDAPNKEATSFFGYRLCKIQSILASMAASKFNNIMTRNLMKDIPVYMSAADMKDVVLDTMTNAPLYEFDCKAWNVPNLNDAYAYLLWRQLDCIRNSKQQAAQTYLPHKILLGLHTDEQIALLFKEKGISWYDYAEGLKYGRYCYKEQVSMVSEQWGPYMRSVWGVHEASPFNEDEKKQELVSIISRTTDNQRK